MYPEEIPTGILCTGQVGYIACNMKESTEGMYVFQSSKQMFNDLIFVAHIGDTLHRVGEPVPPMPGFKPSKAMVCLVGHSGGPTF